MLVATVVTAAPLIQCELDSDGEVRLTDVDHVTVRGSWHSGGQRRVIVMHESEIRWLAQSLYELAERAGEEARFKQHR